MASDAKMRSSHKRKHAREATQASKVSHVGDKNIQVSPELCQDTLKPCDESPEPNIQHHSPSTKEVVQEDAPPSQDSAADPRGLKKTRGPTKMKDIAVEPGSRIHVEFTDKGEPCGEGSVSLSSYLGPLVREHVSVTLHDWRKLGDDIKVVLWKSIQARFDLEEEWQKAVVFKSMGCIWRASKSRLVSQIQEAKNKGERLRLQPKNIQSRAEWKRFIRAKTSPAFKERVNVVESDLTSSSTTNVREDALSKVLGHDKPGRLRGMGRGMTISKLAFFQTKDKHVAKMQEQQINMQDRINHLENLVNKLVKNKIQQSEEEEKTSPMSVNTNSLNKCKLLDWSGTEDIVAEGRWVSSDPEESVNEIPLGPNAMKVLVDISNKPDAFLWRPTSNMFCFQHAQGKTIAWPADRVIFQMDQQSEEQDNLSMPSSSYNNSRNKCKLFDWTGKDEVVAEGRWHSSDPKALVNGIPLGPNAMIVWVDIPKNHEAFLWRPTIDMTCIEDVVNSAIAWPANKVVLEKISESQDGENASSPSSVNSKSKKRCKLLDVSGSGQIVAEGRWSSSDPDQVVHFVPLGPNAMRVWVDTPKVPTASLWRPSSELEIIEDAIGTTIAWPADKVVFF